MTSYVLSPPSELGDGGSLGEKDLTAPTSAVRSAGPAPERSALSRSRLQNTRADLRIDAPNMVAESEEGDVLVWGIDNVLLVLPNGALVDVDLELGNETREHCCGIVFKNCSCVALLFRCDSSTPQCHVCLARLIRERSGAALRVLVHTTMNLSCDPVGVFVTGCRRILVSHYPTPVSNSDPTLSCLRCFEESAEPSQLVDVTETFETGRTLRARPAPLTAACSSDLAGDVQSSPVSATLAGYADGHVVLLGPAGHVLKFFDGCSPVSAVRSVRDRGSVMHLATFAAGGCAVLSSARSEWCLAQDVAAEVLPRVEPDSLVVSNGSFGQTPLSYSSAKPQTTQASDATFTGLAVEAEQLSNLLAEGCVALGHGDMDADGVAEVLIVAGSMLVAVRPEGHTLRIIGKRALPGPVHAIIHTRDHNGLAAFLLLGSHVALTLRPWCAATLGHVLRARGTYLARDGGCTSVMV